MKKLTIITLALLAVFSLSACFDKKGRLRREVAEFNRGCPAEKPGLGRLDSVALTDNDTKVAYYITIHEGNTSMSVDMVRENAEAVKRKIINSALAGNRQTLKMFQKNKVGIRYVFAEENSGKRASVDIPLEYITTALSRPLSQADAAEMALKDDIAISMKALPSQVERGLTITDLILDKNQLVYVVSVDENIYPLSGNFNLEAAKEGIIEGIESSAQGQQSTINNLVKTSRGITYRYVGNRSKKQIDVEITTLELRTILSKL